MILDFKLPVMTPHMSEAVIECLFVKPGDTLKAGTKLLDLSVDLSSAFAQECPPITYFRIIVREAVVVREMPFARGQRCKLGDVIAVFATSPDDASGQPAQRGVRFATAGIMHHEEMWTGSSH